MAIWGGVANFSMVLAPALRGREEVTHNNGSCDHGRRCDWEGERISDELGVMDEPVAEVSP